MEPAFTQETPATAGEPPNATQSANDKVRTYEIVSIKQNKSESGSGGMRDLPDGFAWTNIPLSSLVQASYGIIIDSQVLGLPDWARREKFDIIAKVDADTAERWKKLSRKERWSEEQPMMRSILADRCQFKGHQETKELPAYELVVAKGGLKMKDAPPDETATETVTANSMVVHAMTITAIVAGFEGTDGRIIVDKTGLGEKKFDFELKWTGDDPRSTDDAAPSLLTALEEQLGLKLVPASSPTYILVIERMVRPSPN